MSTELPGIRVAIPGLSDHHFRHLLLDFNGTLARDGILLEGLRPILRKLGSRISVHVLTADTHGTVSHELGGEPLQLHILPSGNQAEAKVSILHGLAADRIAIGNGSNDRLMLGEAELGIALLEPEACSAKALAAADIICVDIFRALELLSSPARLAATLRES